MKRWTPEAIELLKKQSEQSRRGESVTPGNGTPRSGLLDSIKVSVSKSGRPQPKNGVTVELVDEQGKRFHLRIARRRKNE